MTEDSVLLAWEYPRGTDVNEMVEVAPDEHPPPDLLARLLSSRGDAITLQVVDGVSPVDPEALIFVQGRGAIELLRREHELLRREQWPGGRTLLVLWEWAGG